MEETAMDKDKILQPLLLSAASRAVYADLPLRASRLITQ